MYVHVQVKHFVFFIDCYTNIKPHYPLKQPDKSKLSQYDVQIALLVMLLSS